MDTNDNIVAAVFYDDKKDTVRLELTNFGNKEEIEEHTSELQSHHDLVCRLLLEKKNKR